MSAYDAWLEELLLLAALAGGGLLLGALGGMPLYGLLAGTALYLAWHLGQLARLMRWLEQGRRELPPRGIGAWHWIRAAVETLRERGRRRKRKYRRLLKGFQESTDALPDATVVLDRRDRIEWWNRAARRILGLQGPHKGTAIQARLPDPRFRAYLAGGDYREPLRIPSPVDPDTDLEIRVVPYGKSQRLLQARDITRLNRLETVRRDFVANVSHELRTPLTVVHGYLEPLAQDAAPELAPWRPMFEQMHQQTTRMQRIVEDLLLLARLERGDETGPSEPVAVARLLTQIREEAIALSGDQGHRIELEADPELALQGNAQELYSAFSNLVFNAVRYTPAGGEIRLAWRRTAEGAEFAVRDTGIGIAPEHIPRLTERFYRVDVGRSRQSGGTGLGLAIVKHVLSRHQGRLLIESTPGEGSTFRCRFPPSRIAATDLSPASPRAG